MPLIRPTIQPAYYVIRTLELDGVTPVGQATGINDELTVISAEGENAFLEATKAIGTYKPLPNSGWLESGTVYGYNGSLVIVRQSHWRTGNRPEDVPALFSVYRAEESGALAWVANEKVEVGARRNYGGKTYRCQQGHVTQADWTPPATPALWAEVSAMTAEEWAVGVAYKVGNRVTFLGAQYECLQAHTSQVGWTPPVVPALWKKV